MSISSKKLCIINSSLFASSGGLISKLRVDMQEVLLSISKLLPSPRFKLIGRIIESLSDPLLSLEELALLVVSYPIGSLLNRL
jgi:hypothetical protein